jgi:hypothetical protein
MMKMVCVALSLASLAAPPLLAHEHEEAAATPGQRDVTIATSDGALAGTLTYPAHAGPYVCVVIAGGTLSHTRDGGFDGGPPRPVSCRDEADDLTAAIAFARGRPPVLSVVVAGESAGAYPACWAAREGCHGDREEEHAEGAPYFLRELAPDHSARAFARTVNPAWAAKVDAAASALDPDVAGYNYVLGTQTFGVKYQFTAQSKLVETAAAILAMGSNILKFSMGRDVAGQYGIALPAGMTSLAQQARDEPSVRAVLDMPFAYYLIWAYAFARDEWRRGLVPARRQEIRQEIYDFTAYLLRTYDSSGKTFLLGHWEGDWWLLGHTDPAKDPDPAAIAGMIDWLNVRQEAIEAAARDTPHRGVRVCQYTEVNLVQKALGGGVTVATHVLPHTRVDYVSYSCYDSLDFTGKPFEEKLTAALTFIESKLSPKPSVSGKRVFIGEYGFPLELLETPERQDAASRALMRAALAWGCPFILYWELHCNEIVRGKHRGFWLIDEAGVKQPVYRTHERFLERGRRFVASFKRDRGRLPTAEEYRASALHWLDR